RGERGAQVEREDRDQEAESDDAELGRRAEVDAVRVFDEHLRDRLGVLPADPRRLREVAVVDDREAAEPDPEQRMLLDDDPSDAPDVEPACAAVRERGPLRPALPELGRREQDRKSTRLNSSHQIISYAVFCVKKKMKAAH